MLGRAFEPRSVINGDRQRQTKQIAKTLEHHYHAPPSDRGIDLERQALAAVVIHDGQAA